MRFFVDKECLEDRNGAIWSEKKYTFNSIESSLFELKLCIIYTQFVWLFGATGIVFLHCFVDFLDI